MKSGGCTVLLFIYVGFMANGLKSKSNPIESNIVNNNEMHVLVTRKTKTNKSFMFIDIGEGVSKLWHTYKALMLAICV